MNTPFLFQALFYKQPIIQSLNYCPQNVLEMYKVPLYRQDHAEGEFLQFLFAAPTRTCS